MSKKMKIDCHGDPVTIEVTDKGDVIFHGWDQEAEQASVELGFEPSQCFIIWKALNDGLLDQLLIDYSKTGEPDIVRALIFVGADVHAEDDYALQWASRYGHAVVVKILLKAGANVRAIDDYALRSASQNGHANVVKILLEAGADVHTENDHALRSASGHGHANVVRILLKAGADVHAANDHALQWASENGHADVVKILKAWIEENG